jgi:lipoprotein-anchoring transpeptidase ErfK/SrfK
MRPAQEASVPLLVVVALLLAQAQRPSAQEPPPTTDASCTNPLSYQVMLDRIGFSPGTIDGAAGPNLRHAVEAFQTSAALPATGNFDCATSHALMNAAGPEVLSNYTLTAEDVNAQFLEQPLPADLVAQAQLGALLYESVTEALSERFHASPRLLLRLNPGVSLVEGAVLRVPAVTPFDPSHKPVPDSTASDLSVFVSRSASTLRAVRADGTIALFAPVSSGSTHDPLPIGEWKVTGSAWMPPFHYNPELFWDAEPGHSKAVIKPGPNNPVGVVWIDINVPHYGMHGTSRPELVGHAQSHGCVRLTNWDAARLASLVKPGTRVIFSE